MIAASSISQTDRLVGQEVPERERPDHRRDEQGLDDRDTAAIECGGLEDDARDLRAEPEEPDPLVSRTSSDAGCRTETPARLRAAHSHNVAARAKQTAARMARIAASSSMSRL
jgi:hypothetical protein